MAKPARTTANIAIKAGFNTSALFIMAMFTSSKSESEIDLRIGFAYSVVLFQEGSHD